MTHGFLLSTLDFLLTKQINDQPDKYRYFRHGWPAAGYGTTVGKEHAGRSGETQNTDHTRTL